MEINLKFKSIDELRLFIQMNMPIAIKPTKKAKTQLINPFTSENARSICIDSITQGIIKQGELSIYTDLRAEI
jgi:hypothetical protein